MKQDEYNLVLDIPQQVHPKRMKYILKKWDKWGWLWHGRATDAFCRVKDLIVNKEKYIDNMDGRVVIVHFIQDVWGFPTSMGILLDLR